MDDYIGKKDEGRDKIVFSYQKYSTNSSPGPGGFGNYNITVQSPIEGENGTGNVERDQCEGFSKYI